MQRLIFKRGVPHIVTFNLPEGGDYDVQHDGSVWKVLYRGNVIAALAPHLGDDRVISLVHMICGVNP